MRFKSDEAASIHYTTDGSTPTTASMEYKPTQARALPVPLTARRSSGWPTTSRATRPRSPRRSSSRTSTPPADVSANVPATLSLAVAPGASLGTFAPGVARTYTTSPAASVTSTAGEAALSVADPSPTATGHLVNGTFALPQPLRARVGAGGFGDVGSAAAPLGLHSWSGPVSNDTLAVDFSQAVGANDPLRTGTYSKTLTLSTTSP